MRSKLHGWLWGCLLALAACTDHDTQPGGRQPEEQVCKVVVLMQDGEKERWQRTAQWALQNLDEAQRGLPRKVTLELEFKNQDDADIADYMERVAADTAVAAIVGPTTSERAEQMAVQIGKHRTNDKPLITPSATDVEFQRKFANTGFVWNMAESDIAQLEVLLSSVASSALDSWTPIVLLAKDNGNNAEARDTYAEWFGFIAGEYGLKVEEICFYNNEEDVRRYARKFCGSDERLFLRTLLFNPSDEQIALAFDDEVGKIIAGLKEEEDFCQPHIFCSDAFVTERVAQGVRYADFEGVDLYASPESGFAPAYAQRFGQELLNGEAQFYDALCLTAYAATYRQAKGGGWNEAILQVVDGRDGKGGSWLPADMHANFEALQEGRCPDIDGVSGDWTFDPTTHAYVKGSTFRRWRLYDHRFLTMEYVSTEGTKHSSSSKAMWDWKATTWQDFDEQEGSSLVYPPLGDRWALLVAASNGWRNYRFQADVFAMYQLLRRHGYDDDHIVLIVEDDVADSPDNPEPGVLRVSDTGPNVYAKAAVDYRLSDLTPDDLSAILHGQSSARLPHVLRTSATDNVFIFWSSHGGSGVFDFGGIQSVTHRRLRQMLTDMPRRKLLFAVEACYSGGVGEVCRGLPGALFITAANPYEASHPDEWSDVIRVYRSNGFTKGFLEAITAHPSISLRDLYYVLARNTTGSHVKVYNMDCFGSVYDNTMAEFLK